MLDERELAILKLISSQSGDGGYKVFVEEDFSAVLEETDGLCGCLAHLERGGYIAVKYASHGLFCVRALPLAKEYEGLEMEKRLEQTDRENSFGKAAFWGGACGGAAASAFFFLLIARLLLFAR